MKLKLNESFIFNTQKISTKKAKNQFYKRKLI